MISIVCEGIGKEPMNVLNENKSYDFKKRIQYPTLVSQEILHNTLFLFRAVT